VFLLAILQFNAELIDRLPYMSSNLQDDWPPRHFDLQFCSQAASTAFKVPNESG